MALNGTIFIVQKFKENAREKVFFLKILRFYRKIGSRGMIILGFFVRRLVNKGDYYDDV